MFDVTFNVGINTTPKEVVVKNIPAHFIRWTHTINTKGNVIFVPTPNMNKIYDLWMDYGQPIILDCRGKGYCTYDTQDH